MKTRTSEHFEDITQRLNRWSTGAPDAENELFEAVLPNLQRLAQYLMKGERSDHPLESMELVNQTYFRLAAARKRIWQDRKHFFAVAARAMRQYLIDIGRVRRRNERFIRIEEIEDCLPRTSDNLQLLVSVACLLDQLAETDPNWSTVVELKYFIGLTDEETAESMGIKLRTMQRMWADARQWLFNRMNSHNCLAGISCTSMSPIIPARPGTHRRNRKRSDVVPIAKGVCGTPAW